MTFTVYILESSSSNRLYIGHTNNFQRRFKQHMDNLVVSTKNRGPWVVLKTIVCKTRSEAMLLEQHLKKMKNPARVRAFLLRNYSE